MSICLEKCVRAILPVYGGLKLHKDSDTVLSRLGREFVEQVDNVDIDAPWLTSLALASEFVAAGGVTLDKHLRWLIKKATTPGARLFARPRRNGGVDDPPWLRDRCRDAREAIRECYPNVSKFQATPNVP